MTQTSSSCPNCGASHPIDDPCPSGPAHLYFKSTEALADRMMESQPAIVARYLACQAFVAALKAAENDEQRERMIQKVGESVCLNCGSLHLPCYCTRNE